MNNTRIINIFNSENSNIAYIKTQHCQIMTAIVYIILKLKSMIKKPIKANHAFFAVVTFSKITSFVCINSIVIEHLQYLAVKNIFIETLKQPFADPLQNRCSQQFRKFHWKIPALESLFNKLYATY